MKEEKLIVERRGSKWKIYAVYGLTAFIVIAAAILLVFMFVRHEDFTGGILKVRKALAPALVGAIMAYIMNPLMVFFEGKLKQFFYKHAKKLSRADKAARVISIIITVIIVLMIVGFLIYLMIPQLITTVTGISTSFQDQVNNVRDWYIGLGLENSFLGNYLELGFDKLTVYVQDFVENRLLDFAKNVLGSVATGAWRFIGTIYNILIGLIFSIYILGCKEKLAAISKKITYAVFKRKMANNIVRITRACHSKFTGAITGKIIDSFIIGVLCYVAMVLLDIPYPPLVSAIVGVTNVIPFFGPFIGAIPSSILILFASPVKCLYFIILIVVLQQLDGNLIGPKIVGESVGLSPFWVLFACTFFGSLWGVVGMLIAAPLMACIYMIVKELVENRLHRKGLMIETSEYEDLDRVDETEMFCMVVDNAEPDKAAPAGEAAKDTAAEPAGIKPEEYVPATIKELNRAAGTDKYSIDSDFEFDEPEKPEIKQAPKEAPQAKKKNPIEFLKGLKRKK
ncbi:MAG: AI-2E family transporter [Lachnospiraceae bacterium]|nr:AI-2E family transporter [Lachnospiraceae bacterium]